MVFSDSKKSLINTVIIISAMSIIKYTNHEVLSISIASRLVTSFIRELIRLYGLQRVQIYIFPVFYEVYKCRMF